MTTLFASGHEETGSLASTAPEKTEITPTLTDLSAFTGEFLAASEKAGAKFHPGTEGTIRVSEVLGSLAHLYERIRNVVEYKGEHVLRRNAIERMLKRLLWEHAGHDTERVAQVLLRELIWARYIPNDFMPKSKTKEIAKIISKYLFFLGKVTERGTNLPLSQLRQWVWGVASCEIEECVDPASREPYVELMYQWFKTYFVWQDEGISEHEKNFQIYLGIHRALTKSDEEIMRFHLLVKEYPEWLNASHESMTQLVDNFFKLHQEIEAHLNFKDKHFLFRLLKKQVAPFEVLRELVQKEGKEARGILQNDQKLQWKVREICEVKYAQIQQKVNRGTVRSILYIFITKVVFALLIEVPYELRRFGALTIIPLAINVVVPPSMMWLIGFSIRAPGEDNTQRILSKLKTIVYDQPQKHQTRFSLNRIQRSSLMLTVFSIFYLVLFILVFGGLTYFLLQLHYTWLGIGIFFAFLSLVLLFGYRVRFTAQELKVMGEKESFFGYVFNNLTLPFLNTGVYLSKGLAKINFFTVILDFLIEAPLKTIIEVVEEWTSFIREKREEVVEVPEQ